MEKICFSLQDVLIGYADCPLCAPINLKLHYGEMVCLIGNNGSGKSSLLRTLSGLLPNLGGKVFLDGKELKEYSKIQMAQKIGIVTTEKIPLDTLTVQEVVEMGRIPYTGLLGKLSDEDKRIVFNALENVEMTAFANRRLCTLSDGERQKVMLAKVIAQQVDVVILDEPTSFLDYPNKGKILHFLHEWAHRGNKAVLLSIHDLEQAQKYADKFWKMSKGKVEEVDKVEKIKEVFDCC